MRKFWRSLVVGLMLSVPSAAQGPAQAVETAGAATDESIQLQTQTGGTILYFPDYVDGDGWSVQLVLGNLDPNRSAPVDVEVYDSQGRRVSPFFNSGTLIDLPAQGSQVLRSPGTGAIRRGWIEVRSQAGSIKGLLTYRDAASGIEVGVAPVELRDHFALFVEESSEIGTGLAIFKPDAAPEIEFQIRDEAGRDPIGQALTLGNFLQQARTLPEWIDKMGVTFRRDIRGLLFLQSVDGSSFAPLGLRFGKQQASLSTVPVIPFLGDGGDGPPNPFQPTQSTAGPLYFPDYVDGAGWSVQLALGNLDSNQSAQVEVEVYDQQGQQVRGLVDLGTRFDLPPQGSRVLRSAGGTRVRRGWIEVEADSGSVRGLLVYRHAETGIEVSVAPIEPRDQFALFVEESSEIGTGLALFKPETAPEIELRIRNEAGRDPVGQVLTFGNFQQQALTLPEWFQEVDTTFLKDFRGMLFVRSKDGSSFAPLGLRFGKRQGSLSAVPVIPIEDDGGQPPPLPPPTVTLSASPAAIEAGGSSTLTWASTNAVSATLTPGIGSVSTSGSRAVSPTATTTYRITVQDAAGRTAAADATITVTAAPQGDQAVLVALYEATDGPNWVDADNWLTGSPLGEWFGVTIDGQGRVIELDLRENNLVGRIPPELGDLAQLQILDLRENQLTGMIPVELSRLSQLEKLYLMDNRLTGTIPWELSRLSQLQRLGLYLNQLTGEIPVELSRLSRLQWLYLGWNRLTGTIPWELSRLSQLERLYLNNNQLTGEIPVELFHLSQLQQLGLMDNRLRGEIPVELSRLSQLEMLFLHTNQLTGRVPGELGDLANLERLQINQNRLEGTIPSSFVRLDRLVVFEFGENQGLCVPKTPAFTGWLEGIKHHSGPYCDSVGGKVYWTDPGTGKIQRANLNGSGVEDIVAGLGTPLGIALDPGGGKLYWIALATNKIQRANLDGTGVEDLVTRLRGLRGIALDPGAGKMYWTDYSDKIQRANLDGSGVEDLVTGLRSPDGIALDPGGGKMYWTDWSADRIQRANLDGSGVEDLVTGLSTPSDIALDPGAGKMYWVDPGADKIQRANLDGSGVEDLVIGLSRPLGIALDPSAGKMYWTEPDTDKIQRANLDGTGVEDLVTGLTNPVGIALDLGNRSGAGGTGGSPPPTVTLSARPSAIESGGSSTLTWSSANAVSATIEPGVGVVPTSGSRIVSPPTTTTYRITVRDASGRTAAAAATVTVTVPPDLIVTSPSVTASTLTPGQSFELRVTVRNQGGSRSAAGTLRYYRSSDATISPSDTPVKTGGVRALAASSSVNESIPLTAPSSAGTYYYGACVDSVSGEIATNNNCSVGVQVTVNGTGGTGDRTPKMYWTNYGYGKIQRANLDGSQVEDLVTKLGGPSGIALDLVADKMYWTELSTHKIRRANLDGSQVEDLVTGLNQPVELALDLVTNKIYWADGGPVQRQGRGKIQRANLDGSQVEDLVTELDGPGALALLGRKMYWGIRGKIQRANLDGTGVEDLIKEECGPSTLTFLGRKMYWTCLTQREPWVHRIRRANLDGTGVEDLVTESVPAGLALDAGTGKMHWTDLLTDTIRRANLDGTGVEVLVSGLDDPYSLALDLDQSSDNLANFAGGKIYWTDLGTGKIQRANLDGSGAQDLIRDVHVSYGLELDLSVGKMYWVSWNQAGGKIRRANLDGSGVENIITGLRAPYGLVLAASKIYWTDYWAGKIQRANRDGTGVEDLVTGLDTPAGLALVYLTTTNVEKMYWTEYSTGKIQRANRDGTRVEDVIMGLGSPLALEFDGVEEEIYWTDLTSRKIQKRFYSGGTIRDVVTGSSPLSLQVFDSRYGVIFWTNDSAGKIQRANRDGTRVEDVVTGLSQPYGLDVYLGRSVLR